MKYPSMKPASKTPLPTREMLKLYLLPHPVIGKIETRAPSPQKRLDALKTLSEQGILTQIRYSPIIPKFDDDAEEVFRQAADCGATDVITEYLRLAPVAN